MGEFQHGLCGCFDDCGLCIITYFVPCYTFGKNAEAVGDSCMLCAWAWPAARLHPRPHRARQDQGASGHRWQLYWRLLRLVFLRPVRPHPGGPGGQELRHEGTASKCDTCWRFAWSPR
uniref:Zf-ANAPC11 domain-containing protein n=1 Tax=Macrostomum lignano TaxID=282301 RepID=A0A1I8FPH0_9PLAT